MKHMFLLNMLPITQKMQLFLLKLGKLDINEFLGPPIQYSLDQLVGLIWRDGHYFPSSINSDHITAKTCDMVNDVGLNDLGFGTHPTGVY